MFALASGTSSSSSGSSAAAAGILIAVFLVLFVVAIGATVLQIVGMWKVFEKAGQPGWSAIVPILNWYVLIRIAGRETWWLILFFVPCVGLVAQVIVLIDLARRFGKSEGYAIGLWLVPFVFFPMLGFGSDRYLGPPLPPVV